MAAVHVSKGQLARIKNRRLVAWQIHYLDRDDRRQQLSAPTFGEAVTLATRFVRDGLIVEKIEADTALKLSSGEVRRLCDAQ
jgi:hypothetical protein